MTKETLWLIYCRKNPRFADDHAEIRITGRGLRKLFDQTYEQAHDQGFRNGQAHAAMQDKRSIFERVFGK